MKLIPFFLFLNLSLFGQVDCATKPFNFSGFCFEYHENLSTEQAGGKIAYIKEFKNDEAVGIWMKFDEKGNLISQLNTRDKKDSLGLIYPLYQEIEINEEELIDYGEDSEAQFPGGYKLFQYFIKDNLIYPQSALDLGIQGKVYVKFTLETDGKVSEIIIVRGMPDCPECDKEVVKLLKSMPNWTPGIHNRKRVRTWVQVPINFTLH